MQIKRREAKSKLTFYWANKKKIRNAFFDFTKFLHSRVNHFPIFLVFTKFFAYLLLIFDSLSSRNTVWYSRFTKIDFTQNLSNVSSPHCAEFFVLLEPLFHVINSATILPQPVETSFSRNYFGKRAQRRSLLKRRFHVFFSAFILRDFSLSRPQNQTCAHVHILSFVLSVSQLISWIFMLFKVFWFTEFFVLYAILIPKAFQPCHPIR